MSLLDALRCGELPHICCARRRSVETFVDAVACGLDLGKGEVHLGDDAGDIETANIYEHSESVMRTSEAVCREAFGLSYIECNHLRQL